MEANRLVIAKAGRDKGKMFAVFSTEGDFAYIVDGKERPLARPKRKRIKHLAVTKMQILDQSLLTDRAVRNAIRQALAQCDKEVEDLGKG